MREAVWRLTAEFYSETHFQLTVDETSLQKELKRPLLIPFQEPLNRIAVFQ